MKLGNLVKHRSEDGLGIVVDIDGLRHKLKIALVLWCDKGRAKYAVASELEIINESG